MTNAVLTTDLKTSVVKKKEKVYVTTLKRLLKNKSAV
jgi:peptide/nickel transport system permease protein